MQSMNRKFNSIESEIKNKRKGKKESIDFLFLSLYKRIINKDTL
jgi:hypothetical protein